MDQCAKNEKRKIKNAKRKTILRAQPLYYYHYYCFDSYTYYIAYYRIYLYIKKIKKLKNISLYLKYIVIVNILILSWSDGRFGG